MPVAHEHYDRFRSMEEAVRICTSRQVQLELTAREMVGPIQQVLAKIDQLQQFYGQVLKKHYR